MPPVLAPLSVTSVTSTPIYNTSRAEGQEGHVGYYEDSHKRGSQEDALTVQPLPGDLIKEYTEEDIAQRVWFALRVLNENISKEIKTKRVRSSPGSTLSMTLFDGKGHLITATVGDSASFAIVYDKEGNQLGVTRLNSEVHKPDSKKEQERIVAAGGKVSMGRVQGGLAVSRALGDVEYQESGVNANATIDITSIEALAQKYGKKASEIQVKLVGCCDGLTDAAGRDQSKASQEAWLDNAVRMAHRNGCVTEASMAKDIVESAKPDSEDNISVYISTLQTIAPEEGATPVMAVPHFGVVCDGHGGDKVSIAAVNTLPEVFSQAFGMSQEAFADHPLGVKKNKEAYDFDNSDEARKKRSEELAQEASAHSQPADTSIKTTPQSTEDFSVEVDALLQKTRESLAKSSDEKTQHVLNGLIATLQQNGSSAEKITRYLKALDLHPKETQGLRDSIKEIESSLQTRKHPLFAFKEDIEAQTKKIHEQINKTIEDFKKQLDAYHQSGLTQFYKALDKVSFSSITKERTDIASQLKNQADSFKISSDSKEMKDIFAWKKQHCRIDKIISEHQKSNNDISKTYDKKENSGRLASKIHEFKKKLQAHHDEIKELENVSRNIRHL